MDTQNPIEENILKLVNEGYEVNDVYSIMTHLGWQPEDVQLSMNQIYERRAKENEAVARQRQEAIDQINASYEDLKKKAEPQQSDSFFGTFPGESSVAFDALDELDSQVFNSVAKSNTLDSMNRGASTLMENIQALNRLKASVSDPKLPSDERKAMQKQIISLENKIQSGYDKMRDDFGQATNMGIDLDWNLDLDLGEDEISTDPYRDFIIKSHMAERKEADAIRTLGEHATSTYKEFMGVDFPDIESIGDLNDQLITMSFNRGLDRARMDEEAYGDPYEAYEMEEYEKSLDDQSMIGSMGRQFGNMLGGMFAGSAQFTLDLGEFINENPYLRFISPHLANLGMVEQLAEGINRQTGFDTKSEILDYKRRLREKDAARARARDKELWDNPMFWGKGMTERDEIILQQLENGDISNTDALELFALNLYQGMENVLPSALYYGGLSMMGPAGIAGIVGSAGSTTYGDLNLDRPDLSFGEKAVIAGVVGGVEGALNSFFKGAEKAILSPAMKMIAPAAIREMGKKAVRQGAAKKFFQNTAMGRILGEGFEESFAYLAELGITNAVDAAAGRQTEAINLYELSDQFQAGMLGGGVFVGAGSVVNSVANRGHYETRNRKLYLQNATTELRQAIASMPHGPERQELSRQLYHLNAEYRDLSAQETLTYGKYSVEDRVKISKLNREIAHVEDMIKYKKDSAGIGLNKEQLEALELRLKGAMDAKKAIESSYDSVEKTAAENAKKETEPAQDVEGNDAPVESTQVAKDVVKEDQKDVPLADNSDPVKQEGDQLSQFNEKEFDQEAAEEAPVEEAPAEEAPAEEEAAPTREGLYSTDNEIDTAKGFDLADREMIGDGANQVSVPVAAAFNKALKGFKSLLDKAGTKVYVVSRQEFDAINESADPEGFRKIMLDGKRIGGFYDVNKNAIVLPSDASTTGLQEEFGHAFMLPIINGQANPELQQELYNDLTNNIKSRLKGDALSRFEAWKKERDASYESLKAKSTSKYREEMIIGFFKHYKNNQKDFKGVTGFIKQAINTIAKKAGHKGVLPVRTDSQLLNFAETYSRMTEGIEADLDVTKEQFEKAQEKARVKIKPEDAVQRENESDEEYSARIEKLVTEATGIPSPDDVARQEAQENEDAQEDIPDIDSMKSIEGRKKFTYLQDTEVFYEDDPYTEIGGLRHMERIKLKKAKFKDYFHFRNWYNHMTSNQIRPRIGKMYFIKDGKKYEVKPPKPKVDKQGNRVRIQGAENQRVVNARNYWRNQDRRAKKVNAARDLWFSFVEDQSDPMKRAGLDSNYGRAFLPGFDYNTYSQIADPDEKSEFGAQASSELLRKTPEEIANIVAIARSNFEALKNSGMSVQELQDADPSTLFNMSNIKPKNEQGDGDVQDMFVIEPRKLPKPYVNKNTRLLRKFNEGNIRDIANTFVAVMGFDISTSQMPGLDIKSGVYRLHKADTMVLEDGTKGTVLTTHIDKETAYGIRARLIREALKQSKNADSGEMAVGFSFLNPESIKGNPDVFRAILSHLKIAAQEAVEERTYERNPANRLYRDHTYILKDWMKGASRTAFTRVLKSSEDVSDMAVQKVLDGNIDKITLNEYKSIIDALIKEGARNLDDEGGFSTRKKFLKKTQVDEFFKVERLERGRDTSKAESQGQLDDKLAEYFNDPAFAGVPPATLVGYRKFSWNKDTLKDDIVVRRLPDKVYGFRYAIVTKGEVEPFKVMRENHNLGDLNPDFRFLHEKRQGINKYPDPQERAMQANKFSLFELNQSRMDDDKGEAPAPVPMNVIEPTLVQKQTDQGTFEMPNLSGFEKWRNLWVRRLVDKYNDIFDIQKAIEEQRGRVAQSQDFKMKEELMYGKAAQDLLKLDKKIEGIKKVMKSEGISLKTVNDYLYALHARERNRVIKERIEAENEKRAEQKKKLLPLTDAGSGMTDADADAILNNIKPSQKKGLDKIEEIVREIQQDTRDTMVNFGLESQETIAAWESLFENYVPLAGLAQDEDSELTTYYPTGGAGLSVFGPSTKRAKGRKSAAENVLAQVISQNAATHIKSRTNEAVASLYELAKENPNPDVWQVLDEANSLDPHVVSVRIGGEQKFIRFKDASNAQNLKNMNLPETNLFLKILRAPSNWLRRSFTTLNPEFVVSNFARDIQTAVFNAAAESEIEGGIMNGEKVMTEIIKTVPGALKSLLRGQVGLEQDPEMKRYYEEFKEDGAKTGWAYAKRLSEIAAELEQTAGDVTRTQEILGVGKNMVDFVEGLNESFEDATRLAAYIAARRNGVSREKAAQLAKNITVNFNKHGEWGQALNGVYLFFNASVQGTSRMLRTIGKVKPATRPDGTTRQWNERATTAQKMAAGLTLFSSMLSMINAGLSGEDEDGVLFYDKIPDYVKERNLIIMNPRDGETYYKIPLPYGFNIFSNIGTVSADVARGGMKPDEGIYFLASGLVNAFSPISFGQSESLGRSLAKGGIPTVAKPFFDAWGFNETYFGGPVAAEQLPFGTKRPESSMSFRSPEAVKSWFSWLNEATGGSDRVSGSIDINPDRMWYVFEYFIGGAGNFVNRTGKTIRSVGAKFEDSDYDISINDIPFLRIMYGEQSRYYDHGKYRDNETRVKQLYLERKDTKDWNNSRYEGILELNNKLKITEKKLKKLREDRRKARDIKDFTRRSVEVQKIMDQERIIIMEFNKRYDELRKD